MTAALSVLAAIGRAGGQSLPPRGRQALAPIVTPAAKHDLSPPLFLIRRPATPLPPQEMERPRPLPGRSGAAAPKTRLPLALAAPQVFTGAMPASIASYEGVGNVNGRVPPDTNADVGPNHVVQWVNLSFAIWDKQGNLLYGPTDGNSLWAGFGGVCETANDGDPVVKYDALANRWLMSQLGFVWDTDFHQCIAISQTADPTGAWYRYDFPMSTTNLNDYPKFGVWPDAYYLSFNEFVAATNAFRGQSVVAFERDKMLQGQTARTVYFNLYNVNPGFGGQLPSDLDGPILPPAGSPNYYVEVDDDAWGWPSDRLSIWQFHVDWTNPTQSTFGVGGEPNDVIDLTAAGYAFDSNMCGYSTSCIPQPGGATVDALSDRLMYRLAYRNFGDHETLVVNHTVDVDGTNHAGIRWYEVRAPGGPAPFVEQAGTFAPDANHRWMGSVAMDGVGDLAVGYSVSSTTTYPSIRYAGRLASDPPGILAQAEQSLIAGTGYQTGAHRWGDYSSMSIDPTDDCTFWYTQEYYAAIGPYPWQTRYGSFRFDSCRRCAALAIPLLSVDRESAGVRLSWGAAANASAYDVVEGDLGSLLGSGGNFAAAVTACLANDLGVTYLQVTDANPSAGDAFWYIARPVSGVCEGTYDDGASSQRSTRDITLAGAALACP